jgi:glycosyltransferase involved in cell wall biosynthesis
MSRPSVCFFAKLQDRGVLDRVEFYAQDVRLLRDLGFDVQIATRLSEIRPADFYFVWWWTWAFFPVWIARLLHRPVIVTGVFGTWRFRRRPRLHQALMRYVLQHATANVFLSEMEHREVRTSFAVHNPYYVPLTVDTDLYAPGSRPREDFILTVGWMHAKNAERKSMPEVIQAADRICRLHPHIRFLIAGEHGSYYPRLAHLARSSTAPDRIEFPGIVSLTEKISLMQRCKVYLQPSRFEGFGLAILEAMSCSAPVLTSGVGAVPEVVGDAARLVDGTSPDSIAEGLHYLLTHPDCREALGARGRARAEDLFPYARRKRELGMVIERARALR